MFKIVINYLQILVIFFILLCSNIYATEYDKVINQLNKLKTDYPDYVNIFDIGNNDQNQPIIGIKIEHPVIELNNKASYLVVGVHHGNERLSANLALEFAKKLVTEFLSTTSDYPNLINRRFYIIPVLNISGYNNNRRYELNAKGYYIDPNRDYPDVCVQEPYFQLKSTQNIIKFIEQNDIIGAVSIHGYIGTFTYPWGIYTTNTKTLDDELFKHISYEATKFNNYRIGTHADVIYPAAGTFEDWIYYAYGIWANLVELQRNPDLTADSKMLLTYFNLLPQERSHNHNHLGTCTKTRGPIKARP